MHEIGNYDVVVVGGGPGGFGAAVAAARQGASTLLVEREGCLGGGGTTMLVNPFMPHCTSPGPNGEPRRIINAGVFMEVIDRLVARGAARHEGAVRFDDEALKLVLDEIAAEAGVKVLFHAALFDAEVQGAAVKAVRLAHNSGPLRAGGKVFVDGTGDALLAERAGCELLFGNEEGIVMPMTLNFIVGGVDTAFIPDHKEFKQRAAKGDKDTPALLNTNLSCRHIYPNGRVHFNAIRITGSTLDPWSLSGAEAEGRRRVDNFVRWLRACVPGFAGCYLVKTGNHIGIRESRRVLGDYMLVEDDFRKARKFDDGVASCCYCIDVHGQKQNETNLQGMGPGEYYHIPYRCLTPRGKTNLLMASRSISADILTHSSLRIMPVVMNIGEAAGTAAAMSLPAGDVRAIDVQDLRRRIRQSGGVLESEQARTLE
jgi:hypothetical protein